MSRRGRPPNSDPKRRARIIEELDEAAEHFEDRWGGPRVGKIPKDEWEMFQADLRFLETSVEAAIRADVLDHPVVHDWISGKTSLGDWVWLRQFRVGLEKGVRRPRSNIDTLLSCEAATLLEEKWMGSTKVRWMLLEKLSQPDYKPPVWLDISEAELEEMKQRLKTSNQNFHKWLRRFGPAQAYSSTNVPGYSSTSSVRIMPYRRPLP